MEKPMGVRARCREDDGVDTSEGCGEENECARTVGLINMQGRDSVSVCFAFRMRVQGDGAACDAGSSGSGGGAGMDANGNVDKQKSGRNGIVPGSPDADGEVAQRRCPGGEDDWHAASPTGAGHLSQRIAASAGGRRMDDADADAET